MNAENLIATVDNVSLCYDDYGNGTIPVIFVHGFPFDKTMWTSQVNSLKNLTRVISYDIRGFGKSSAGNETFSIRLFSDDLVKLMDILEIEKAVICGLSMGGYIALDFIYRYSNRAAGVVLCDTQCIADSPDTKAKRYETIKEIETKGVNKFADSFTKKIFSVGSLINKKPVVDQVHKIITTTSPETITASLIALAGRWETCSSLEEIKIPALIICGTEDKITPPLQSEMMNGRIAGSSLQFIKGAAHMSNLEQPEKFNDLISGFYSAHFNKI